MRRKPNVLVYVLLVLGAIMIIFPMYLTIISAFKPMDELTKSIFAWPSSFYLGNFKEVITKEGFLHSVINTVFITVVACVGVVLVVPLVSYAIARNMDQKKYYKFLYFILLIGIFVPFQVKMMPLVQVMSNFHMLNVSGITVVYIASSVCEGVFLYVAFIQGVPGELEESAYMDGAGPLYTYGKIIFPLLKPMTATVLIMDGLWFWNDFFLPLLALNKTPDNYTLTLFIYNFKSQTTVNYSLIFAGLLLVMLPIMILYVFLQKQIMGGLVNGAVKG